MSEKDGSRLALATKSSGLICQLHTEEECAGKGRAVHVARIAVCAAVEVLLKRIEDILHSGVDLHGEAPVYLEVI